VTGQDFTTTFTVDNTPDEVFAAINDVRGWWSEEVVGGTTALGDTFRFEVPGAHRTTQTLTDVVPGRRVVWHVSDAWIGFVDDTSEWDDTDIVFDISGTENGRTTVRFTHAGLTSAAECYDACSSAWSSYMLGSLRSLITTGRGDPHRAGGDIDSEIAKHGAADRAVTV
jgi:uncharacterized protein YndB with AHSA1/START domain